MHTVILKFHLFIVQISLYNNKEAYHYEKHLIMFSNTALIVMGLRRSRPWWSCWKVLPDK